MLVLSAKEFIKCINLAISSQEITSQDRTDQLYYTSLKMDGFFTIVLMFINIVFIKKESFINPDGISLTLLEKDLGGEYESFICSSLWNFDQERDFMVLRNSQRKF